MIAGAALSAWLADRDAQRRSLDAADACIGDWSRHPLMTGLARELDGLSDPEPDEVLAAARRFMDRTEDFAALMRDMIGPARKDPFFRPPFHPLSSDIHHGLLLFAHPLLLLSVGVTGVDMLAAKKAGPRGPTSVGFTGQVALYRYVRAGGATVSLWEAELITDDFVASQAGECRMVGHRRLEDGDELLLDGRHQSFIIEHATSDIVYFQAMVRTGVAPLTAEYDGKSMAFIGASSTDEASSRIQMMVSMLRTMGREDALPLIEESLASPYFHVRWHIMREFLAMDAEAALPPLRRMAASDPHPEVRATAQQTLRLFFEDEALPQAGGA